MKRLSVIGARGAMIVALGAMTTGLAACGGHQDDSAASAPGAKTTTSASASAVASSTASSPASSAATTSAATTSAAASSAPVNSKLGPASRTTCATFKNMSIDDETSLVKKVLAENPGSRLQGSPNVALGTAKLVCLSSSEQDKPIAVALGVAQE